MLTWLIVVPVVAAIVVAMVPSKREEIHLPLGITLSVLPLALAAYIFYVFEPIAGFQFTESAVWYEPWGISWSLGLDGISMPMVLLTTLLVPIALGASTGIKTRRKEFVANTLFLEAGMIGVFLATDLFLFFVFFEVILVPMYFIIGIWGSDGRKYAAMKFFLYTAFGSALMLAGIIALALTHADQYGSPSFSLADLMSLELSQGDERWLFAAFALAFAIKVPLFPFHTWLPDAHTEAPTAGSVILAGVLLKMGTYGFLRFSLPMFPLASAEFGPLIYTLSVVAIIYTSLVALMQDDMKKLIAYSSVAHMGFVTMGIFAANQQSIDGAIFQMISHGFISGALFLCVGVIYDRMHTREIAAYGGIVNRMPVYAAVMMLFTLANVGLPGTSGFVGEFLTLAGTYQVSTWTALGAATGVVLSAAYALWLYRRVLFGDLIKESLKSITDLNAREVTVFVPLVVMTVLLGVYPSLLTDLFGPTVEALVENVQSALAQAAAPVQLAGR